MRRELVAFSLGPQAVEVSMIRVLQHLGRDDCRHKRGVPECAAWRLDPDGHVDGHVEEQTKEPMGKEHCALAGRSVTVGFQHAAQALQQQEPPYNLLLGGGVPDAQLPCGEQRAGYRGDVEVGEEGVGNLQRGGIIERLAGG